MTTGDLAAVARVAAEAATLEHSRMRGSHDCGQSGDFVSLWRFFAAKAQSWSASGVTAVAEDVKGRIVGFAVGLPSSSNEPDLERYAGDLTLLGVLPEVEGMGVGSRLVCFVAQALNEKGLLPMLVWTWDGSDRAQGFYLSRMGARGPLARKSVRCEPGPMEFDQVSFGWPDARSLLQACEDQQPVRTEPGSPPSDAG